MKNEGLLPELARALREEDAESRARWDERWDRLAAGTLSAEEEAELAAMARTDPEARAAYEAFRPLGEEFQARVVAAIRERQEAAKQVAEPAPAPAPRRKEREATSWWRGRPLWAGIGGLATAGAAVALMMLVRPVTQLPPYKPLVLAGIQDERSGERAASARRVFRLGDPIWIETKPTSAVEDGQKLVAECYLVREAELRKLEASWEAAPSGAFQIEGQIPLHLSPGTWNLWVVVGRKGKLPPPQEVRVFAAAAEHRGRDWAAIGEEIDLRPKLP